MMVTLKGEILEKKGSISFLLTVTGWKKKRPGGKGEILEKVRKTRKKLEKTRKKLENRRKKLEKQRKYLEINIS